MILENVYYDDKNADKSTSYIHLRWCWKLRNDKNKWDDMSEKKTSNAAGCASEHDKNRSWIFMSYVHLMRLVLYKYSEDCLTYNLLLQKKSLKLATVNLTVIKKFKISGLIWDRKRGGS